MVTSTPPPPVSRPGVSGVASIHSTCVSDSSPALHKECVIHLQDKECVIKLLDKVHQLPSGSTRSLR